MKDEEKNSQIKTGQAQSLTCFYLAIPLFVSHERGCFYSDFPCFDTLLHQRG